MARLKWDEAGKRRFETGISNCALYVSDGSTGYNKGVAWNGITSVSESPEGAEPTALYADNMKYLNLISAEDLKLTLEAYTYPDEFCACNGEGDVTVDTTSGQTVTHTKKGIKIGQQSRLSFCLAYKTKLGNDLSGDSAGEKIHIIYGCTASPSERSYESTNDSPDAITFSYEISTVATTDVPAGMKPTSILTIDQVEMNDDSMWKKIDEKLFGKDPTTTGGSDGEDPTLLTPKDIYNLINTSDET